MERIDKFYEKINGGYFALLNVAVSMISILIAIVLYIQWDPSFTLYTHFISDLGDGKNYSNIVFNISRIITGCMSPLFYLYFSRFLYKKGVNKIIVVLGFISGLISAIGSILVGLYPSATAPDMHRIGAAFAFFSMFFILIFYSLAEYSNTEINKSISILGFLIAPLPVLFLLFYVILYVPGININIPIFTEWLALLSMSAWVIIQGIYLLKNK